MCCMPVFRGRHTRFTSEAARTTVVRHSSRVSARRNPSVHRRARVSVARFQNARTAATACPCPRTVCVSRSPRAAHRCNRQISIFRDAVARRAVGCWQIADEGRLDTDLRSCRDRLRRVATDDRASKVPRGAGQPSVCCRTPAKWRPGLPARIYRTYRRLTSCRGRCGWSLGGLSVACERRSDQRRVRRARIYHLSNRSPGCRQTRRYDVAPAGRLAGGYRVQSDGETSKGFDPMSFSDSCSRCGPVSRWR